MPPAASGVYVLSVDTSANTVSVTANSSKQWWTHGSGTVLPRVDGETYYVELELTQANQHQRHQHQQGHAHVNETRSHPPVTLRGSVVGNCSTIYWENDSVWCKGLEPGKHDCGAEPSGGYPDPLGITKAYVVFSNHLDVGYV